MGGKGRGSQCTDSVLFVCLVVPILLIFLFLPSHTPPITPFFLLFLHAAMVLEQKELNIAKEHHVEEIPSNCFFTPRTWRVGTSLLCTLCAAYHGRQSASPVSLLEVVLSRAREGLQQKASTHSLPLSLTHSLPPSFTPSLTHSRNPCRMLLATMP